MINEAKINWLLVKQLGFDGEKKIGHLKSSKSQKIKLKKSKILNYPKVVMAQRLVEGNSTQGPTHADFIAAKPKYA